MTARQKYGLVGMAVGLGFIGLGILTNLDVVVALGFAICIVGGIIAWPDRQKK